MKFEKGKSGNPKGRPKGTKNKRGEIVDALARLVDDNLQRLQNDLDELEPRERVRAITGLMAYVVPKLQATTEEERIAAEYEQLNKLLEKAPDAVIDELFARMNKIQAYNGQTN